LFNVNNNYNLPVANPGVRLKKFLDAIILAVLFIRASISFGVTVKFPPKGANTFIITSRERFGCKLGDNW